MGCPQLVGALALPPLLLWALLEAGTFLCPLYGPRGKARMNFTKSLWPNHLV